MHNDIINLLNIENKDIVITKILIHAVLDWYSLTEKTK